MAAVTILWFFATGFAAFALRLPCYFASVGNNGEIDFSFCYPHKRVIKTFLAEQIATPVLSSHGDSDGDSHFSARLILPDGSDFVLAESIVRTGSGGNIRDRLRCEEACDQFSAAIERLRA